MAPHSGATPQRSGLGVHIHAIFALPLRIQVHVLHDGHLARAQLLLHDVAVPAAPGIPVRAVLIPHLRGGPASAGSLSSVCAAAATPVAHLKPACAHEVSWCAFDMHRPPSCDMLLQSTNCVAV